MKKYKLRKEVKEKITNCVFALTITGILPSVCSALAISLVCSILRALGVNI